MGIWQFPAGFALGFVTAVAPRLLRPFLVLGILLFGAEGVLGYHEHGSSAFMAELLWLVEMAKLLTLGVVGLGLGHLAGDIILGRS